MVFCFSLAVSAVPAGALSLSVTAAAWWYPAARVVKVRFRSLSAAEKCVSKLSKVRSATGFCRHSRMASVKLAVFSRLVRPALTAVASLIGSLVSAKARQVWS